MTDVEHKRQQTSSVSLVSLCIALHELKCVRNKHTVGIYNFAIEIIISFIYIFVYFLQMSSTKGQQINKYFFK